MVKLMLNVVVLSLLLCLALAMSRQLIEHRRKICMEPEAYGSCNQKQLRWYHDPMTSACKPFYYSGCGGNYNRFNRETLCWDYCMDPAISYDID
ncbi:kunitz-type serine protease inhibitor HCRG2-like [Drosophila obscura]|uniref:kunitz-type serine protease inhibitor HCRG2-like n=1 Tax=Drosophila obscura TaxID=7282 RepID=UPI000BA0621E|nr:kunitz-type serine protease inhibitor HCRG2-like [Drosophila obscura]